MLFVVAALAVLWLIAGVIVLGSTRKPAEIADLVLTDEAPVTAPTMVPLLHESLAA